ncbi:unnamed protein product [Tuber aestivum]|uniref:ER-bound oxygenase mpaB/mpaB'/Rubber oxygenase catalytic domain-containing protein n=1 Tax=Tuber aestivum TaxID=59557 RepID=A0A292PS04_9PEZI|nr:unnamed protein product [Tuber aestivum]
MRSAKELTGSPPLPPSWHISPFSRSHVPPSSVMSSFRTRKKTISAWGHTYVPTPLHPTAQVLAAHQKSWDTLADEALDLLTPLRAPSPPTSPTSPPKDLYTTLKEHRNTHSVLSRLWQQVDTVPEWVDWEQISRGQDVFYRYSGAMLAGLCYMSLLGGMGASRIAEVLYRTGGFSAGVARRRMFETMQHILQCTQSLDSIKPGGAGQISSVKVRLLHAAVRKRILEIERRNPGYYSVKEFGVPVNDLDSIGTVASFSSNLVWGALPKQGLFLSSRETEDYIALWRLVAHYVGCPTHPFSTPALARAYYDTLVTTQISPTPTSATLASNILTAMTCQPPTYPTYDYLVASVHWVCPPALCDALGLPPAQFSSKILVSARCIFNCCLGYTARFVPWFDKWHGTAARRMMWKAIVLGETGLGGETGFEFSYLPRLGRGTKAGKVVDTGVKGVRERKGVKVLGIFLLVVGVLGVALGWCLVWVAWALWAVGARGRCASEIL